MKKKRPSPSPDKKKKTPGYSVIPTLKIKFAEWKISFSTRSGKDRILFIIRTVLLLFWFFGSIGLIGYWLFVPRIRKYNYDFTKKETIRLCEEF